MTHERHFVWDEDIGIGVLRDELHAGLERMIAIQTEAYPSSWSPEDKRELAEKHLFGPIAERVEGESKRDGGL